jgi:hypothetical protein
MFVDQISSLFQQFADESDTSFITPAQRQLALQNAYEVFRSEVAAVDPFYYAISVDFTVTNASIYPIGSGATVLLGPSAAAGVRMERPLRIATLDDNGDVVRLLSRSGHLHSVRPVEAITFPSDGVYQIINRSIVFDRVFSTDMRLWYIPEQNVEWTKEASGDNEYVDDLNKFHDIIAMIAIRDYYQVRDGMQHQVNDVVVANRIDKLRAFMVNGWMQDGANVPLDVYGV